MKILVLGADGYLGWPTCMHLASIGYDVIAVDNYMKRQIAADTASAPLVEMPKLEERSSIFKNVTGKTITTHEGDLSDHEFMRAIVGKYKPDTIIHYAEQPSGPYSMLGHKEGALTLHNNVGTTFNLIMAVDEHCPEAHIVKLGCYSSDTEVLTDRGWILFTELTKDDQVCCLESESEKIQYHHPSAIVEYPYDGPMLRAESKGVDFLVTPNHRVVFKRTLNENRPGPIEIERADNLPDIQTLRIPRGGTWEAEEISSFTIPGARVCGPGGRMFDKDPIDVPMDKWLPFFGLWISEGTIRKRGKDGAPSVVRISVKKKTTVDAVRKAMNGLEIYNVTEYTKPDGCIEFDISNVQLAEYLATFGLSSDKRIPRELLDTSARQLEILFEALMEGDGTRAKTQKIATEFYFSTSKGLLSDVQEICLKIGRVGNICNYKGARAGGTPRDENYISIGTRNIDTRLIPERMDWEPYGGTVHCCTVPTGIIMTRRNGKVCWSGNTMGEYGTPNTDIPEGWFDFEFNGRKDRRLFPRQAGSFYHTTKILDTDILWFWVRNRGIKVTDLMQGPVYGMHTEHTALSDDLGTHFWYDDMFGTALNRFVVQAVHGMPLTVYGKGGQTRGYLDIRDTMQCVTLATENPALQSQLRIMNQFTEDFSANKLAQIVHDAAGSIGIDVAIDHIENPRIESEDHYYNAKADAFAELGLKPHLLTQDTVVGMLEYVKRHKDKIDPASIMPRVTWKDGKKS